VHPVVELGEHARTDPSQANCCTLVLPIGVQTPPMTDGEAAER